jgi:energy-coupling factor transport system ATP-binding protein
VIRFDGVTVTYADADAPTLAGVNLRVEEGELCLVVGTTGSGKSTLLRAVNGLVPHFSGGTLSGRVTVAGRDTRDHPPRELADVVGMVGQDPVAGFVADNVEEELAYSMESLGLPGQVMRKRVEETLDLLGLAELRGRPLATLSGGQQQRVAIGAALTAHPRVLVLDEPTSALDPGAAEEVLAALQRLVHDLGMTVLIAEHRLERVAQYADRVVWLPGAGAPVRAGPPGEVLADSPVAPPVVRLGRVAGWHPPPVSVRDARRLAGPLRERLAGCVPPSDPAGPPPAGPPPAGPPPAGPPDAGVPEAGPPVAGPGAGPLDAGPLDAGPLDAGPLDAGPLDAGPLDAGPLDAGPLDAGPPDAGPPELAGPPRRDLLRAAGIVVRYPGQVAVRGVDLVVAAGERVALMGRNGSGKSSLLWALQGSGPRHGGTLAVGGADPAALRPGPRRGLVGLVPQQPADLLYLPSVRAECAQADAEADRSAGACRTLLDRLVPGVPDSAHPRDLSEGQRLALVLAVALSAAPRVLLLDEPTRGLDYPAKSALAGTLRALAAEGRAVVLATHDVEFVAEFAGRVVVLADGEVVADGPTAEVVTASPVFAPQVAKVLAPQRWLTVDAVATALAAQARA